MNNHSKKLTQGILVLSGVVGGLAVATTLVSFNGGGTDPAEASSAALADRAQGQQDTAAPEQPPTTVVVYVNEDGTVIDDPESTGSGADAPDPEDTPVVESETEDTPVDAGSEDGEEGPTTDEDDGPLVMVEVPIWTDDIIDIKPWELIDICEQFPWICGDDGPLVEELPEPCDPDDGTCPGWVIEEIIEMMPEPCGPGGCPAWVVEDLIQTIDRLDFEYNPIDIVHPEFFLEPLAIGGWAPIGF
ncbi:MAG: hypothetical protein P8L46_05330 [Acidimicrobiales bacterium]|nr:hypothetical protein [Acidimicrobiales bacterium]MDG2217449.1 hypothetical protein [Acidimicrobiales bacterium]